MQYFVNLPASRFTSPGEWATEMEQQGWYGVCASDHLWVTDHPYPHVFVTATQMAMSTSRVVITTSFCNNLFRSPVEFAQAAFTLQQASGGRFEAGLGAGWAEAEMIAMGESYPAPGERMSRYIEAMQVTRQLLTNGQCEFDGHHYQVNISGDNAIGPIPSAPVPLIGSVGGPRGIRSITPLVDRVEVKASARSTRGGAIDLGLMASVTEDEVRQRIEEVKAIDPDKSMGIFLLIAAGESDLVQTMKASMGNGYLGNFMGHPAAVAEALSSLTELGIDRVQLTEFVPGSHTELAPHLLRR